MKRMRWAAIAAAAALLAGCFSIEKVVMPGEVASGASLTATLEVKTDGMDENPHHGIVAFKIPNDWQVNNVSMKGDYGKATLKYLPADVSDGDTGGKIDYWEPALERIFPSGDSMKWMVYQTPKAYKATSEVAFQKVMIDFKAGAPGEYDVDFLVTEAALDFDSPEFYGIRQGMRIIVK
jgi:hypothetical protein